MTSKIKVRSKKSSEIRLLGKLQGHQDTVISLIGEPHAESPVLCSGSEDGSVRIWDLRQKFWRSCGFLGFPGEGENPATMPVTDLQFHPTDHRCLYSAVGKQIFATDLRQLSDSILLRKPSHHRLVATMADEINAIRFNPNHTSSPHSSSSSSSSSSSAPIHLVAAIDDGSMSIVHFADAETPFSSSSDSSAAPSPPTHTVKAAHENICSALAFCGAALVSGGFDAKVVHWRPLEQSPSLTPDYEHLHAYDQMKISALFSGSGQIFNPPFVQSLLGTDAPSVCVAGLGDGTVVHIDLAQQKVLAKLSLHLSSVPTLAMCGRRLASGGNDGRIMLSSLPEQEKKAHPTVVGRGKGKGRGGRGGRGGKGGRGNAVSGYQPKALMELEHGEKIQKICVVQEKEQLVVADVTSNISIYQMHG